MTIKEWALTLQQNILRSATKVEDKRIRLEILAVKQYVTKTL